MGNAAKWLGKLGQVAPKLVAVFQKIVKKVENVLPDNFKHDKRKDSDAGSDDKNFQKEQALMWAKVITEGRDKKGSSIPVLKANLAIVKKKYPVVKRFDFEHVGGNRYKVWMIASKKFVDDFDENEKDRNEAHEIASLTAHNNSGLFNCMECAAAIIKALKAKGLKGKIIDIETPYSNIWNNKLAKNVSTNGKHRAVFLKILMN